MNDRPDEAEALLEEGLARDTAGDVRYLRTVLAHLMLLDGRYREALERFAFYLPDTEAFRLMGETLETGDATRLRVAGTPRGLPHVWTLVGEPDRALDMLEEMAFAMPFRVQYDLWDPVLAPLWDTPRFRNVILPRLRLEGARVQVAAPENAR